MANPELERFLESISPHIRGDYGVQLVAELEPLVVAFDRATPDRLYCGRAVFDDMVRRGVLVKAPLAGTCCPFGRTELPGRGRCGNCTCWQAAS